MSSRSEKRKNLRLMLMLGFSSSAAAVVTAFLVWAWSPLSANWTLPAQQIAETPAPSQQVDRRWVPMHFPARTQVTDLPSEVDSSADDTATEIASVETSAEIPSDSEISDVGYPGPIDFPPQGEADISIGPSFSFAGLGGPATGGGGSSWKGTFNPNPTRGGFRSSDMPSYTGGGGGSGGGSGTDPCDFEPAKSQDPSCKSDSGEEDEKKVANSDNDGTGGTGNTDDGTGGSGSICTTTIINGVVQNDECLENGNDQDTETGNNDPTTTYCTVSTVNGTTTYEGDCPMNQVSAAALTINSSTITDPSTLQVPEPSSLAIFLAALAGLVLVTRRRHV